MPEVLHKNTGIQEVCFLNDCQEVVAVVAIELSSYFGDEALEEG